MIMATAKQDFLWYKKGQTISEKDEPHVPSWKAKGYVEGEVTPPKEPVTTTKKKSSLMDKVKDVLDDGKLNNSVKKKSKKKKSKK